MNAGDQDAQLIYAMGRQKVAVQALRAVHNGGEYQQYLDATSEVKRLEREIATSRGQPYAVRIDFPVEWNTGAPCPHLVKTGSKTFLSFLIKELDSDWDGTYINIIRPESVGPLALVEFHHCRAAKMGSPNDEVFDGHPLANHGMEPYTAQIVRNSAWLLELEAINSVHQGYNPKSWIELNHYVFWFHDETFECVAKSYTVEQFRESFVTMMTRICQRLS